MWFHCFKGHKGIVIGVEVDTKSTKLDKSSMTGCIELGGIILTTAQQLTCFFTNLMYSNIKKGKACLLKGSSSLMQQFD